jgi:hypothetical protein
VRRALRALLAAGLLLAAASAASAHIPDAETVARAAADASRAQGRNRAFSFAVAVRAGASSAPNARGELLVDPGGAARIELRHDDGFVERQIRRASGLVAARDGEALEDPHPLAPPLWPLLAATGGELLARAGELGVAPGAIALGYDGARDCFVIGGVTGGASIWIDTESYQVARVDLADGTHVRFLAFASRGGALLPGTIEIETASLTFTLELTNAAPATPAADAFSDAWLLSR